MPHIKKLVLGDYWTVDAMMETPFFKKYMTPNRFRQLLRYLHFADNDQPNAEDRLWKIRNVAYLPKLLPSLVNFITQSKN